MNCGKILLSLTVLIFLADCKKHINIPDKDINTSTSDKDQVICNVISPVINKLNDQKGTIIKDQRRDLYVLSVPTAGTIDEVSMYIICNPDRSLLKDSSIVKLSGNIRTSKQVSRIDGMMYYDLEVTKINK